MQDAELPSSERVKSPAAERTPLFRQVAVAPFFIPVLIVVFGLVMGLVEPRFLSTRNLSNILVQCSYLAIAATAQTIVMIGRGIDLSLGSAISMVSVVAALIMTPPIADAMHPNLWAVAAIAGGLAAGFAAGLFNGLAVARFGINPVITTLGSYYVCTGLAASLSDGRPVFNVPASFSWLLYDVTILGIKAPIVIAVMICLCMHFFLVQTTGGRSLYLIGSNPKAAVVAGMPVRRRLAVAYILASILAACCALMLTARTGSGEPSMGANLMLPSIAATVIGGVSLRGGAGSIAQAVSGALLATMIANAMNMMRVSGYYQDILLGIFVVLSVFVYGKIAKHGM